DIEFARAQLVFGLLTARLAGHVGFAALEYLSNVPAVGGAEGLAELVDLQLVDHSSEVSRHAALVVGPAHVAPCNNRGGIIGKLAGNIGEVLSPADAGIERINEFLGLIFGAYLIGRNENVAHMALIDQAGDAPSRSEEH